MFVFAFAPCERVKEGEGVVRDEKRVYTDTNAAAGVLARMT